MRANGFITVVIPFKGNGQPVKDLLFQATPQQGSNLANPEWRKALEQKRPRLIHFLSMAVVDPRSPMDLDTPPSRGDMSHLMIEVSSDSGATETLRRVAEGLEGLLVAVFNVAKPEGWDAQTPVPSTNGASVDALARLMLEHHRVIGDEWGMAMGQLHDGSPAITVERILAEKELSDDVTKWIDDERRCSKSEWIKSSPMQRLEQVRTWLWDVASHKKRAIEATGESANEPIDKPMKWAFAAELAPVLHAAPAGIYQAHKAAISIAHKLLWPLYILLTLLLIKSFWETRIAVGGPLDYRNLLAIPALMLIVWLFLRPRQYPFIALLASTLFVFTIFDWSWVKTVVFDWSSMKWTDSDWLFVKSALLLILVPVLWLFRRARQYPFIALIATTLVAITVLDSFGDALLWFFLKSVAIVVATAIVLLAAYWRLRQLEEKDPIDDHTPELDVVSKLMAVENRYPQNHMFTISTIKPGLLRWLALRGILTMIGSNLFISRPGFLGKNGVIHSARWLWIRDPKPSWRRWWLEGRLIFWSNYDGTWESYVGDFVADSPDGVTGLWSNCVGFPRAKNLTDEGAKNRDRLVRWARRQQTPTPFWYSAYPRLTNARIRINAAIRQGIASAQTDADARDWLSMFASQPRPAGMLLTSQIPTLALGGLAKLPYATCYMINLPDNNEDTNRGWLKQISEDVNFGELLPGQTTAVALALSASALRRLGVTEEAINTFPVPFQEGMWTKGRARALGDQQENDPSKWDWGSSKQDATGKTVDNTVDVFLVIYGAKDTDVTDEHERLLGKLGPATILKEEVLSPPTKAEQDASDTEDGGTGKKRPRYRTEHFGFADGVSQPAIIGLRHQRHTAKNDRVGPGEIVLGYPDSLKRIPPSPLIDAREDPDHILADDDGGADAFRQRPEFSRYLGSGRRDLGANGTFLVVRQLQQHVYKWDELLERESKKVSDEFVTSADRHGVGGAAIEWGSPKEMSREHPTQTQLPLARAPSQPAVRAQLPLAQPQPQPAAQAQPQPPAIQNTSGGLPDLSANASPIPSKIVRTEAVESRDFEHLIAAKLLGRWRDGSPVVRHPTVPGKEEGARQNNFLFGVEDPQGLACPLGAHIRRANPRDSRYPGSQEEIDAVNRHRVLRVGRAYGGWLKEGEARAARAAAAASSTSAKEPDVGLMFMCLNADIERQYEFVQKTWILNRNMNGLDGETCPLTGRGGMFSIPTSKGPIRLEVTERLVTVRGGGYFFMPGLATLKFLSQVKGTTPAAAATEGAGALMKPVAIVTQPSALTEVATLTRL